jgi:hypothetical protein
MATTDYSWMTGSMKDPTNQTPFFPGFPTLPSTSVSPMGGPAPKGTPGIDTGSNSGGGGNAAGLAGAITPLLLSLLGPSNQQAGKAIGNTDQLVQMAQSLFGTGKGLSEMGLGALQPVLRYLTAVAGGDVTALMSATAPERAQLIDQYDTAKRNAATFSPRGGGVTSGMIGIENAKATALGTQAAEARRSAVGTLGQLGESLTETGLRAETDAFTALNDAITQQEAQAKRQDDLMAGLASGLGKAAAAAMPFILAAL